MASSNGTIKYQSIVTMVNGKKVVHQVPISSSLASTQAYSAIGIDKDGIKPMVAAINKYQTSVENAIKNLTQVEKSNKSILNNAMKGSGVQTQFTQAEAIIRDKARAVIKQLSQFQSVLDREIYNAYNNTAQVKAKDSFKIK